MMKPKVNSMPKVGIHFKYPKFLREMTVTIFWRIKYTR